MRTGRIPLKDVIRFKERQWFVEELEVGAQLLGQGAHARPAGAQRLDCHVSLGGSRRPWRALADADPPPHLLPPPQQSRDGDPNAMLRLSKMYLHGQGCQPNLHMAQEWLKKAR